MTGQGANTAYAASGVEHEPQLIPAGGRPLSEQVMAAYYQGDKDEMRRLCLRAEAGLSSIGMQYLTDAQLDERIGRIHVLLAAANDELQRRGRTRNARLAAERIAATEHMADQCRPLDCSDTPDSGTAYPFP